jgi:dipeptidase D
MIASVWELAGIPVEFSDAYGGWTPDPDSPVLALMQEVYEDLYGQEPTISAVHAGLECGVVTGTYPDMDMISVGPTIENVHSPSERLHIPSVAKVMDLLTATLEQMPELEG